MSLNPESLRLAVDRYFDVLVSRGLAAAGFQPTDYEEADQVAARLSLIWEWERVPGTVWREPEECGGESFWSIDLFLTELAERADEGIEALLALDEGGTL